MVEIHLIYEGSVMTVILMYEYTQIQGVDRTHFIANHFID